MQRFGPRTVTGIGSRIHHGAEACVRRSANPKLFHHQSVAHVSSTAAVDFVGYQRYRDCLRSLFLINRQDVCHYAIYPLNPNQSPIIRYQNYGEFLNEYDHSSYENFRENSLNQISENRGKKQQSKFDIDTRISRNLLYFRSYETIHQFEKWIQQKFELTQNLNQFKSQLKSLFDDFWLKYHNNNYNGIAAMAMDSTQNDSIADHSSNNRYNNDNNNNNNNNRNSNENNTNNNNEFIDYVNNAVKQKMDEMNSLQSMTDACRQYYRTPSFPGSNNNNNSNSNSNSHSSIHSSQNQFYYHMPHSHFSTSKREKIESDWENKSDFIMNEKFPSVGRHARRYDPFYGRNEKHRHYMQHDEFKNDIKKAANDSYSMENGCKLIDPKEYRNENQKNENMKPEMSLERMEIDGENDMEMDQFLSKSSNANEFESKVLGSEIKSSSVEPGSVPAEEDAQPAQLPPAPKPPSNNNNDNNNDKKENIKKKENTGAAGGAASVGNIPIHNSNVAPSASSSQPKIDKNKPHHNKGNVMNDPNRRNVANIGGNAARERQMQQQMMAKEDEIDPLSFGGLFVAIIGAALFYWLYTLDQKKSTGIATTWLSKLGKTYTLEDFILAQEEKPLHIIPDEWNALQVIVDHMLNMFGSLTNSGEKYNSESIISKLFRLFHIPEKRLLQPIKSKYASRTLVLDLDTICHSSWTRQKEFERNIRPGYYEFLLAAAAAGWEIVIYANHEDMEWMESPDFAKLDGKGFIQNYLWNKDMYYFNGHRCKDLSRLNRDLSKVIVIDCEPRNVQLQPKNAIILPRWQGEDNNDQELTKLIEFITYLQKADVGDVRDVLEEYRGQDIGEEFRRRYYAAILRQQQAMQMQMQANAAGAGAAAVKQGEDSGEEDGDDDDDE